MQCVRESQFFFRDANPGRLPMLQRTVLHSAEISNTNWAQRIFYNKSMASWEGKVGTGIREELQGREW